MTWNYRIMKRKHHITGEVYYALNEVFYVDGIHKSYIEHDDIIGDSPEEIISTLEMMLADAKENKPILTEEDFGQ